MRNPRILALLWSVSGIALAAAPAASAEDRAVKVDIRGGFVGFDASAYRAVLTEMGTLVGSGVVDQLVTYSYGKEGGTRFCAQLSPHAASLSQISDPLLAIHVDPDSGTFYDVTPVRDCSEFLAPGVLPSSS